MQIREFQLMALILCSGIGEVVARRLRCIVPRVSMYERTRRKRLLLLKVAWIVERLRL